MKSTSYLHSHSSNSLFASILRAEKIAHDRHTAVVNGWKYRFCMALSVGAMVSALLVGLIGEAFSPGRSINLASSWIGLGVMLAGLAGFQLCLHYSTVKLERFLDEAHEQEKVRGY